MAEYVYTIDGFSLTTTWKRIHKIADEYLGYDITSANTTKTFTLDGFTLSEGENIKRVMLTATLNRVGTTDYSEAITVNGLNFSTGSRKLDVSGFAPGGTWDARFYFCASGNIGSAGAIVPTSYECTLYFSDVTLTITTGTGSAFDGQISSLPEGSKILIDEPDGNQGTYSVVHHGYNDGLCLLWRDDVYTTSMFNNESAKFIDGDLDTYLNTTFYEGLSDTVQSYIRAATYPTLSNHVAYGGTVEDITRYVCTPSLRELFDGAGSAEGIPFDYLETRASASATTYWTRSMYSDTSAMKARYVNAAGDDYFSKDANTASGVRPCFCVLEEQLVTPSDDGTYYTLSSSVAAPGEVYLNGAASDLSGLQRDTSVTLSWDAVTSSLVTGYEVWRCDTADGEYTLLLVTVTAADGTIPTSVNVRSGSKGFMDYYYKVKAITTPDTDYLDSDLSTAYRMLGTKHTNVNYYDEYRWLLASVKYYNGSSWDTLDGAKYYNGSQWVTPGS